MSKKKLQVSEEDALVPEDIEVVSVLHQQFQQLPCYRQVVAHLRAGASYEFIRRVIQDQYQCWVEVDRGEVLRRVASLRHEVVRGALGALPGYVEMASEQIADGIDEIAEIAELIKVQKKRIMKIVDAEKNTNPQLKIAAFQDLKYEIALQQRLIETSVDIKERYGWKGGVRPIGLGAGSGTPGGAAKMTGAVKTIAGRIESAAEMNQVMQALQAIAVAPAKKKDSGG